MYSSLYNIIKFVGLDSIYYAINLSVVSPFMIFSDLIYVFSNVLLGIYGN